jgi:hypothetical protein
MIEVKSSVELNPSEIAELFWGLDDKQQAEFFNTLGARGTMKLSGQMCWVDMCGELTKNGRVAMLHIGEFGA